MNALTKYRSIFRIRFINGLQYRLAALAGMSTQFVWGFMEILLYKAFYQADPASFPMEFSAFVSYIWLQQSFLALYFAFYFEGELFDAIASGNIAYELCRPLDLYSFWFVRSVANRMARAALRCMPILIVAAILPEPYRMGPPASWAALLWALLTMALGLLVMVSLSMLVYGVSFYTISAVGVKSVFGSVVEFGSGALIPLPFLPMGLRRVLEFLPFASTQNLPFRIYGGDISGQEILHGVGLQLFWLVILVSAGVLIFRRALKRAVVQGG